MPSSRRKTAGTGGLSGAALKYIAMLSMVMDHIGAVILERVVYYRGNLDGVAGVMGSEWGDVLYGMSRVCRIAGRISFPIYAFLLVEGFLHTRDWRRYWLRLAVFALISEIPFRLAVLNAWTGGRLNVFVELAAGLLVLRLLKEWGRLSESSRTAAYAVSVGAGCVLVYLLKADYDIEGILLISACYLLRESRPAQALTVGVLSFLESMEWGYGAGALAALPLFLYNGRKGRTRWRYGFYLFYPVHLLLLFLIRRFIIGIPMG